MHDQIILTVMTQEEYLRIVAQLLWYLDTPYIFFFLHNAALIYVGIKVVVRKSGCKLRRI